MNPKTMKLHVGLVRELLTLLSLFYNYDHQLQLLINRKVFTKNMRL